MSKCRDQTRVLRLMMQLYICLAVFGVIRSRPTRKMMSKHKFFLMSKACNVRECFACQPVVVGMVRFSTLIPAKKEGFSTHQYSGKREI
jgi:hypothetical protein